MDMRLIFAAHVHRLFVMPPQLLIFPAIERQDEIAFGVWTRVVRQSDFLAKQRTQSGTAKSEKIFNDRESADVRRSLERVPWQSLLPGSRASGNGPIHLVQLFPGQRDGRVFRFT